MQPDLSHGRAIAAHLGKRLGGISFARTARYFHRDESTCGKWAYLEQRLQGDKQARRGRATIVKQLRVPK